MHFYNLHPQDIGPDPVTNLCQFQVFCEVYLREDPTIDLFKDFFYINRQTKMTDGPSLELGGVSIQRRRDVTFPSAVLPSHPKGWNHTWFYCKNSTLAEENPLPGYRPYRLSINTELPGRLTTTEHAQYVPTFSKIRALIANGLTRVDLTHCWVS